MSAVRRDFENQLTHSDLPRAGFLLILRGLPGSSSDAYLPSSLPLRVGVGRIEAARKHSSHGGWEVGAVMAGTGQSQRPCWLKAGIALASGDTRGTEAQLLLDEVLAPLLQILAFTVCLSLTHLGIG